MLYVAAYALGRASAGSRAQAAVLAERAVRLESERRAAEERAAERERARIARDMHDVLAHSISLMVVQAEAGPVVLDTAPARAAAAFGAIAGTGREALDQLRRMLAVLRDEEGTRAPQPTVHDLPELTRKVARAGVEVRCTTEGEPRPLPADCGVAAYRIVQEALTNVVKHAAADRVAVRLDYGREKLGITVTDDGRGPGVGGSAGSRSPGHGHGLIGIRERAAAHGGIARTGPGPGGRGFEVFVSLGVGK